MRQSEAEAAGSDVVRTVRVLIVDDEPDVLALLVATLERVAGVEVHAALTGERALDVVGDVAPDLAVVDLCLPGIDGWEVIERLRGLPGGATLPVIIVSMLDVDHDRLHHHDARAWLVKP